MRGREVADNRGTRQTPYAMQYTATATWCWDGVSSSAMDSLNAFGVKVSEESPCPSPEGFSGGGGEYCRRINRVHPMPLLSPHPTPPSYLKPTVCPPFHTDRSTPSTPRATPRRGCAWPQWALLTRRTTLLTNMGKQRAASGANLMSKRWQTTSASSPRPAPGLLSCSHGKATWTKSSNSCAPAERAFTRSASTTSMAKLNKLCTPPPKADLIIAKSSGSVEAACAKYN